VHKVSPKQEERVSEKKIEIERKLERPPIENSSSSEKQQAALQELQPFKPYIPHQVQRQQPLIDSEIFSSFETIATHAFIGFLLGSLVAWSQATGPQAQAEAAAAAANARRNAHMAKINSDLLGETPPLPSAGNLFSLYSLLSSVTHVLVVLQ
jgi:hypothetical protein